MSTSAPSRMARTEVEQEAPAVNGRSVLRAISEQAQGLEKAGRGGTETGKTALHHRAPNGHFLRYCKCASMDWGDFNEMEKEMALYK